MRADKPPRRILFFYQTEPVRTARLSSRPPDNHLKSCVFHFAALMRWIGGISPAIIREVTARVRWTLELLRHAGVDRISSGVTIFLFRAVVRNSLARNRKTRDASAEV